MSIDNMDNRANYIGTKVALLRIYIGQNKSGIAEMTDIPEEEVAKMELSKDFTDLDNKTLLRIYFMCSQILNNRTFSETVHLIATDIRNVVDSLVQTEKGEINGLDALFNDYYLASMSYRDMSGKDIITRLGIIEGLLETERDIEEELQKKYNPYFDKGRIRGNKNELD